MLTALAILGVLAALFLAAALATLDREGLAPAERDAADVPLPEGPLGAADVRALRFGLAARGYRMSEVDAALDRLAAALEDRDRRLAELERTPDPVEAAEAPGPVEAAEPAGATAPATLTAPVAVPTAASGDEAFGGAEGALPTGPPALPAEPAEPPSPPDLSVGQAPVEPVDPPAGLAAHLDMPSVEQAEPDDPSRVSP